MQGDLPTPPTYVLGSSIVCVRVRARVCLRAGIRKLPQTNFSLALVREWDEEISPVSFRLISDLVVQVTHAEMNRSTSSTTCRNRNVPHCELVDRLFSVTRTQLCMNEAFQFYASPRTVCGSLVHTAVKRKGRWGELAAKGQAWHRDITMIIKDKYLLFQAF